MSERALVGAKIVLASLSDGRKSLTHLTWLVLDKKSLELSLDLEFSVFGNKFRVGGEIY